MNQLITTTVIHLFLSPEAAATDIPHILKGELPTAEPDLGTKNYSKLPVAIVLGAAYTDENVTAMRKDCTIEVPWLRADNSKPTPSLGPEYGKAMVERVKASLGQLKSEGKLGPGNAGDFWY